MPAALFFPKATRMATETPAERKKTDGLVRLSSLPRPIVRCIDLAMYPRFFYAQRIKGFTIGDQPHFDPASYDYFISKLREARSYLEYGGGGSTVVAAREGKVFKTVDSDPYFLDAVKRKISSLNEPINLSNISFIHADIGLTQAWGTPVFHGRDEKRLQQWRNYPLSPWNAGDNFSPDLVLVDGRFRVACALASIRALQGKSDWELLVDDYEERYFYKEIEKFAILTNMAGRMAIFKPREGVNLSQLNDSFELFSKDWR